MTVLGKGGIEVAQQSLKTGAAQDPGQGLKAHQAVGCCKDGYAFDHLTVLQSALHQLHGPLARKPQALQIVFCGGDVNEIELPLTVLVPQVVNLSTAQRARSVVIQGEGGHLCHQIV